VGIEEVCERLLGLEDSEDSEDSEERIEKGLWKKKKKLKKEFPIFF